MGGGDLGAGARGDLTALFVGDLFSDHGGVLLGLVRLVARVPGLGLGLGVSLGV